MTDIFDLHDIYIRLISIINKLEIYIENKKLDIIENNSDKNKSKNKNETENKNNYQKPDIYIDYPD